MTASRSGIEVPRVLVSVAGFGRADRAPLQRLLDTGWHVDINESGKRLSASELLQRAEGVHALIAGTEELADVVESSSTLRLITRLGVGLDTVPLQACADRGIAVSTTPTAVAPAVAELAIGLMLAAARGICTSDRSIRAGGWERPQGRRIGGARVGIVGFGRIGQRVARNLAGFGPALVSIFDTADRSAELAELRALGLEVRQCELEPLLRESDLISLHLPATPSTIGLFDERRLRMIPAGGVLVNTARGSLIDEDALARAIDSGHLSAAGLDVFIEEPYVGGLAALGNTVLTAHIGPAAIDCRAGMEGEAVADVIAFFEGRVLTNRVELPAPMAGAGPGGFR